jgi:hypothetical protein
MDSIVVTTMNFVFPILLYYQPTGTEDTDILSIVG